MALSGMGLGGLARVLRGGGRPWSVTKAPSLLLGGLGVRPFSASPSSPASSGTKVLVKIGAGEDCRFRVELGALEGMDRMDLLKVLKKDDSFCGSLKGVPLDQCKVCVLRSVADNKPTAKEEEAVVGVEEADTIGEALQAAARKVLEATGEPLPPADKIFVRVRLPGAVQPAGILRTDATADEVYALLGPQARAAVDAARAHRKRMAGNRVLKELEAVMPAADAEALGIKVLRRDDLGNMAVGMFEVPALSAAIAEPPKTFDDWRRQPLQVLLLPQRLLQAFELVDAVAGNEPLGVHLSGPNGVGKSAIALLAYLLCAARGLPAVYIARAESWVDAAHEGGGHAYFLDAFWRQNADLIIERPALRSVFAAALQDGAAPNSHNDVKALRAAVRSGAAPGLAVIMDEVQHITKAVQGVRVDEPTKARQTASDYFTTNWYDWTNDNAVFQRMSVASAHAHRDIKLPNGEVHRLRFIEPLGPADRAVLQETPQSPAYVHDPAARERAVYIGGNVLRNVITAAHLLPHDRKPTKRELSRLWTTMWDDMLADSMSWLQSVPKSERTFIARTAMDVVTGKVAWSRAEQLYDAGVVFRTAESELVQPVSAVACAVILRVMASHALESATPLLSISNGSERGYELERQFLGRVDGFTYENGVPTKLLDGSPAPAVDLRCGYALPFTRVADLVARDVPVLYRPTSRIFACDGVLMPAATDVKGKIWLIECSTSDPLDSKRVRKVHDWFRPSGIVAQTRALHPGLTTCVVLAYDGLLPDRTNTVLPSNDKAIALSRGEAPAGDDDGADADAGASLSSTASVPRKDAAGGAAAQAVKSAAPSGRRGRPRQLPSAAAGALPRLGDVVRVVDAPSLTIPLALVQ